MAHSRCFPRQHRRGSDVAQTQLTPYELLVGLRYTRARRGSGRYGFVSFIAAFSMLGIALAVASHIEIRGLDGSMSGWQAVAQAARANPEVRAEAPFVLGQAMLSAGSVNRGALIRGVDPALENTVADFASHMRAGKLTDLKPGEFGIVLGIELAHALGVRIGDSVVVITPQGTVTPAGMLPRLKSFRVV